MNPTEYFQKFDSLNKQLDEDVISLAEYTNAQEVLLAEFSKSN